MRKLDIFLEDFYNKRLKIVDMTIDDDCVITCMRDTLEVLDHQSFNKDFISQINKIGYSIIHFYEMLILEKTL